MGRASDHSRHTQLARNVYLDFTGVLAVFQGLIWGGKPGGTEFSRTESSRWWAFPDVKAGPGHVQVLKVSPKEDLTINVDIMQADTFNPPNEYIVQSNCVKFTRWSITGFLETPVNSVCPRWAVGLAVCHLRAVWGVLFQACLVVQWLYMKPHLERTSTNAGALALAQTAIPPICDWPCWRSQLPGDAGQGSSHRRNFISGFSHSSEQPAPAPSACLPSFSRLSPL